MSIRVAYVPEHFSTPLFFAEQEGYYGDISVEWIPVPEGSGRLIKLLSENEADFAVGLTEAFVADIAKGNEAYNVLATYVESPLCWAISTGINRDELTKAEELKGKRISVSRIGSGSYIMSFVLGLQLKFPSPFFSGHPTLSNFKNLRDSVNLKYEDESKFSEAFMWEHFTSKKYYDTKEIKKIGEIYTPWPSWVITCRRDFVNTKNSTVKQFLAGVNKGIEHFKQNPEKAVDHIATHLDYTKEDAREWMKTVKFNEALGEAPIDWKSVVENTAEVLKTAGVLTDDDSVINERLSVGVLKKVD